MKREYTGEELAELKKIYDESGEAGLQIGEMRALRKAGLLTQDLPPEQEGKHEDTIADDQAVSKPTAEPSKRDLILAHCKNRIAQGMPFDGKETAEALGISQKTVGNILGQLRKEGLLPAFDKHSPRKTQKTNPTGKRTETMTTATIQEAKPEAKPESPRALTANMLSVIYGNVSALQNHAFRHNDKIAFAYAQKTCNELMDLKANYSKDVTK